MSEDKVDGFINHHVDFSYLMSQKPELNFSIANFVIATELCGFALLLDNELTHELDSFIMNMRQNGEIQKLGDKWFTQ